jgi:hypothetical protein
MYDRVCSRAVQTAQKTSGRVVVKARGGRTRLSKEKNWRNFEFMRTPQITSPTIHCNPPPTTIICMS